MINTAIVGLSATTGNWASWSHLPALLHPTNAPHYKLVALCNSSPSSAASAAKAFNIPPEKAYHDIKALAADPDIQLVVISVKVPKHYELVMAVLEGGKDVFCEWPLGNGLKEAEEMLEKAREKRVRTMVCLQGRVMPVFEKAKELIAQGKIGDVMSTTMHASEHFFGGPHAEATEYVLYIENGQNILTVHTSHSLDTLCYILDSEFLTLSGFTSIRQPQIPIIPGAAYSTMTSSPTSPKPSILRTVTRTSPDQVLINGTLQNNNIPVSMHIWAETPPTKSHFYWRISGTKGYLEFRGDYAVFMSQQGPKLFISDDGEEPKEVLVDGAEMANNLVGLYERFARNQGGYPRFEEAVVRHRMVEAVFESGGRVRERVGYDAALP